MRLGLDWAWLSDCLNNILVVSRIFEGTKAPASWRVLFEDSYVRRRSELVWRLELTISPLVTCSCRSSGKACLPRLEFAVNGGVTVTRVSRHSIHDTISSEVRVAALFLEALAHVHV